MGTRLRSAVPGLPKCMAPVAGHPFLHHVLAYLQQQGIKKIIFSLGYMSEVIIDYIKKDYPELDAVFSIEAEPLGTGGAIKLACGKATAADVLVINGDTIFSADIKALAALHYGQRADCTLALKPMTNFERYGAVMLNRDGSISSFAEKQFYEKGLINGGVYLLNTVSFLQEDLPLQFSFEKDYLEKKYLLKKMYGMPQDAYFIDIGIPEDFKRANEELM
jgi:D-glycero-alpha-D-manno-heptose 1-phosphate guanylyltransferase